MCTQAPLGDKEPAHVDAEAARMREVAQGQMQRLYEKSLVKQRAELAQLEGNTIREALQEKVRL